jgi:uncharacterized membrane protein
MSKGRMEAFSDGVIAVIITIMVLELRAPREATLAALVPLIPVFLNYLLSFVILAIYWNNHHHLLQAVENVDGRVLWANMHLLFWLSLIPFVTSWVSENPLAPLPVAIYGCVLLFAGLAYFILTRVLIERHGRDSVLASAVGGEVKGQISLLIYLLAVPLAFVNPLLSVAIYALVAVMWLVPDRRIEDKLAE